MEAEPSTAYNHNKKNCEVFVGNLSAFATPAIIFTRFRLYGEIERIRMRSSRYAYITFTEEKGAFGAISADGAYLKGKFLRVKKAMDTMRKFPDPITGINRIAVVFPLEMPVYNISIFKNLIKKIGMKSAFRIVMPGDTVIDTVKVVMDEGWSFVAVPGDHDFSFVDLDEFAIFNDFPLTHSSYHITMLIDISDP